MSNMESFYANPLELKNVLMEGMKKGKEEGEVTDEELTAMMDELEVDPTKNNPKPATTERPLKGEGGSGELKIQPPKKSISPSKEETPTTPRPITRKEKKKGKKGKEPVPPVTEPASQKEEVSAPLPEERSSTPAVPEGEEDQWDEPHNPGVGADVEEGDVTNQSTKSSSYVSVERGDTIGDLREYMESQFRSMMQIMTPLLSRVESLERKASTRAPFVPLSPSPPRLRSEEGGSTHLRKKSGGVGPVRASSTVELSVEDVGAFVAKNPSFPSIGRVRESKLKVLQSALGLEPLLLEVKPSDWNKEGLYTLLVSAHHQETPSP